MTVLEGRSVNISCTSIGEPVPTISWRFNNLATPYLQTDSTTNHRVVLTKGSPEITPGSLESTLHIVNTTYPADEGVYTCFGSQQGLRGSASAMITVQVLGMRPSGSECIRACIC